MKKILALLLFCICYSFSHANDTLYSHSVYRYDSSIRYTRKMVLTKDSGWLSLTYNNKNILVTRAYFADTNRKHPLYCHYYYKEETGILMKMLCFSDERNVYRARFNEKGDTMSTITIVEGRYDTKKFPGYDPDADADPYFPRISGGDVAWQTYLIKNLRYPKQAFEAGAQGTVIINFLVGENGALSDFQVEQSPNSALSEEALRVIKHGPAWIPAVHDGKKVSMRVGQPVVFRMEGY